MNKCIDPVVDRLLAAPYGHHVWRDSDGNSHVTLYGERRRILARTVAPTFDEAVTSALDIADAAITPTEPTHE